MSDSTLNQLKRFFDIGQPRDWSIVRTQNGLIFHAQDVAEGERVLAEGLTERQALRWYPKNRIRIAVESYGAALDAHADFLRAERTAYLRLQGRAIETLRKQSGRA